MEELRSTEALDREILEDARKKADRILKTADQTVRSIGQQWQEKLKTDLAVLEQMYRQRTEKTEHEIMARLPLDKHRLRSERAERVLQEAASAFCASLPRDRILTVLQQELMNKVAAASETTGFLETETVLSVSVKGLLKTEADTLLSTVFKKIERTYASDSTWSDKVVYPEIICETTSLRLVVSFKAVVDQLLLDKRSELAVALLGKGVIND
jgi:V/A-type H+-transporting ATPase subunit E